MLHILLYRYIRHTHKHPCLLNKFSLYLMLRTAYASKYKIMWEEYSYVPVTLSTKVRSRFPCALGLKNIPEHRNFVLTL